MSSSINARTEWLIPCNLDFYDLEGAFTKLKRIDWRQVPSMKNANVGDPVYIYCTSRKSKVPGAVKYKGVILKVNKPAVTIDDTEFGGDPSLSPCFEVAAFHEYDEKDGLSFPELQAHGLKGAIMGPRKLSDEWGEYLHRCDERYLPSHLQKLIEDTKEEKRASWLISPGEKGSKMDDFVKNGIAAIDWWGYEFGDLTKFASKEEITSYMQKRTGSGQTYKNDALCLYQFSHDIQIGDIIICKGGHTELIGVGIVSSPYYHADTDELGRYNKNYDCMIDTYKHRIKVEWLSTAKHSYGKKLPLKTLTKLSSDTAKELLNLFSISSETPLDSAKTEEEIIERTRHMSTAELRALAKQLSNQTPKKTTVTTTQVTRNLVIAEYAKRRAEGKCQLCGKAAPFLRKNGEPYLESHHIIWLSEGGADSIDNTVALCPNCHRKMHEVKDPKDVEKLKKTVSTLENRDGLL